MRRLQCHALLERGLDRSENTNCLQCTASPYLVIMNFCWTFVWHRSGSSSSVCEPRLVDSATQRDLRHTTNSPASVQKKHDHHGHVSDSPSVGPAFSSDPRVRNTCRQHSRHLCGCRASHSFGAELGRPPMCWMINGLHSIERCACWRHHPFHPTGLFWDLFQRPKRAQNLPRSVKAPFGTLLHIKMRNDMFFSKKKKRRCQPPLRALTVSTIVRNQWKHGFLPGNFMFTQSPGSFEGKNSTQQSHQ